MNRALTYNVHTGTIQHTPSMSLESKIIIGIMGFTSFILVCFIMYILIAYSKQCGSRFKSTGNLMNCFESSLETDHTNKKTTIRLKYKGRLELSPRYGSILSIRLKDFETLSKEKPTITNASKKPSIKDWNYEYDSSKKIAHIRGAFSNNKHGILPGKNIKLHLSENMISGKIDSITVTSNR